MVGHTNLHENPYPLNLVVLSFDIYHARHDAPIASNWSHYKGSKHDKPKQLNRFNSITTKKSCLVIVISEYNSH